MAGLPLERQRPVASALTANRLISSALLGGRERGAGREKERRERAERRRGETELPPEKELPPESLKRENYLLAEGDKEVSGESRAAQEVGGGTEEELGEAGHGQ